jgi:hypothetical protein
MRDAVVDECLTVSPLRHRAVLLLDQRTLPLMLIERGYDDIVAAVLAAQAAGVRMRNASVLVAFAGAPIWMVAAVFREAEPVYIPFIHASSWLNVLHRA